MSTEPHDLGGAHAERLYGGDPQREWERLSRHRTEFAVTMRALRDYLPPPPARVLDCGGGPGRFAIALSGMGYAVTLFDLSVESLCLARERAAEAGFEIEAYAHGTATDLSRYPEGAFDAVLMMGPLYHLLEASSRRRALEEARRVLTPGGVLFAAFITRYAPIRYYAAHDPTCLVDNPQALEQILADGALPPPDDPGSEFVAYFSWPQEVHSLLREAGYEVQAVLGVEGLVSMIEGGVNQLQGEAWERWADLNYQVAGDTTLHGCAEHLLAIAVRPQWRAVLRQLASSLADARVEYKVVGGAATALHGVPIAVRDIDLEMDAEGAYRFGELYAEHAVLPVSYREGETYRSHFGRFRFGVVVVEVMGDLERRTGDGWVPSATRTETTADVEGVAVRTSWLEEEALAYIRRDRLERAAQCLPLCDHERLLSLIHGEQRTDVV
ncbi:MAG TPA: methyltransferase domain-containing protein [Anaerolineae bacterium]|nr:methyltransferase domain-containing protein [Anaerolineae bacterium]